MFAALAPALTGLGLFFAGIRFLASNLSLVAGASARRNSRRALGSTGLAALSGVIAGLVTQSTNAVALIVVSFARAGIIEGRRAAVVPTWSHVGASALVFVVALDTKFVVAYLLGLCGAALYFDLKLSDRARHAVMAMLGAGMLLLGLATLKAGSDPLQLFLRSFGLLGPHSNPAGTLLIGVALAVVTQSSTVAGAIAVALVGAGVFGLDTALLLLLGANGGSGLNYAFLARSGEATGRKILLFQATQKFAGTLALLIPMVADPGSIGHALAALPADNAHRIATGFLLIQLAGSLACTLPHTYLSRLFDRIAPPRQEDVLAKPAFLVEEAVDDAELALDLVEQESHRLLERLPPMLDRIRDDGDTAALDARVYCSAGLSVAAAIKRYIAELLDRQPAHGAIVRAMRSQQLVTDIVALHETLQDFVAVAELAATAPGAQATVSRMIESLHMLLGVLVEAVESGEPEEWALARTLLGQRDELMEGIRKRLLAADPAMPARVQEALFHTTILFERAIWLARDSLNASAPEQGEEE